MPDRKSSASTRAQLRRTALARWDNEGGAGPGRHVEMGAVPADPSANVPPLSNAELVQLQIRVIALESVVMALLSEASGPLIERARERAACISPRPGHTPHRLTIHAAARIVGLIEDSARFCDPPKSAGSARRPDDGEPLRDETS
ncbi:MAG: hypothetical protein ABIX46_06475 [Burkholderiaceae bacterium]